MKILTIADTQVSPEHDPSYMSWIGDYILDLKPTHIVHIGDHYDFPSLSSYDKGKRAFEGRRLKRDIEAGNKGMELLLRPLWEYQDHQRRHKKKIYSPGLHFCVGNHEERFDRLSNDIPELDGFVGTDTLPLAEYGWEVHPFLQPAVLGGIHFVHYLSNPFSGRPYGGTAMNQLKHVGASFVCGHKQTLDVCIRPTLNGSMQIGIINGACYPHDEDYKGPQGNTHFRGLTVLHEVKDGFGCPMFVSLDYLRGKYGG